MPGWTNTLQTNSNIVNFNPYLDSDSVVKNSNLAFDLSSLNYDAPGLEGWNNRLKGLTQTFNPVAWADTWTGVSEANARKRQAEGREGNFLSDAWENITGYVGANFNAFFEGTAITEKLATGVIMSVGSGLEELTDFMSGHNDSATWFDKIGKSFDLSNSSEIGSGKALLYTLGQVGKIFAGGSFDKKAILDSANGWLDNDFDIFNAEDRKKLNEGFLMGSVGGILNFAGTIFLDATALIPGGAFVKAGHLMLRGMAKAGSAVEKSLLMKARVVDGASELKKGWFTDTLDWLAENKNIEEIHNYLKAKGWNDDQVSAAAVLLHQSDNRNEVIDTLLSFGHGGADGLAAKARLVEGIMKKANPELSLFALNSVEDGGRLSKLMRDPKYSGLDDVPLDELEVEYATAVKSLIDNALSDSPIKDLVETANRVGTRQAKNAAGELVDVSVTAANRQFGIATTGLGRKYIQWSSKVTNTDGLWKYIEYMPNVPWLPTVVRAIRRAGRESTQTVNWDNTAILFEQFKSRLADIDSITKGAFARGGSSANFLERFFKATTDTERRAIWGELDDIAEEAIIKKHKLYGTGEIDSVKGILKLGQAATKKAQKDKADANKIEVNPKDNSVTQYEHEAGLGKGNAEATTSPQLPTEDEAIEWYQLDKYLSKGEGRQKVFEIQQMAKPSLEKFNSLWSGFLLLRPARLLRERAFGTVGILLSGNFYDVFLGKNAKEAYLNFFNNIPTKADRLIDRYQIKKQITGSYFGNIEKSIAHMEQSVARGYRTLFNLQEAAKETMTNVTADATRNAAALADDIETRVQLEAAKLEAESGLTYHASTSADELTLADGEFIMSSETSGIAKGYANPESQLEPVVFKEQPRQLNEGKLDELEIKKAEIEKEKDSLTKRMDESQQSELNRKTEAKKNNKDSEVNNNDIRDTKGIANLTTLVKSGTVSISKLKELQSTIEGFVPGTILSKHKELYSQVKKAIEAESSAAKKANDVYLKQESKLNKLNEELSTIDSELEVLNANKLADTVEHPQRLEVLERLGDEDAVYMKMKNGQFKELSQTEFDNLTPEELNQAEFFIGAKGLTEPRVHNLHSTGEVLDVDNPENIPDELMALLKDKFESKEELAAWFKSNQAKANNCNRATDVIGALTNLGMGAVHFTDSLGKKVVANNPNLTKVGQADFEDIARKNVESNTDTVGKAISNPETVDPILGSKEGLNEFDLRAKAILDKINGYEGNIENVRQFARNSKSEIDRLKSEVRQLQSNIVELRRVAQPVSKGLKTRSTGKMFYNGQQYDNFAEGRDGEYAAAIASPADTWNKIHGMDIQSRAAGGTRGKATVPGLAPDDPRYYEGLASWLQVYGRGDAVVVMLANGKTPAEVIDWLRNSEAGKLYAQRMKIGSKYQKTSEISKIEKESDAGYHESYEDFVNTRADIVNAQLFTPELKQAFNDPSIELTGALMREILMDVPNLPVIAGRVLNPGEMRKVYTTISSFFKKVNKLLVEKPQEVLENLPLATEIYNSKMQKLIDSNTAEKGRALKVEEINGLQDIARREAIKEMQKWMYNVQNKTNFEEAVHLFVPFVTAYTFTVKMFMRAVKEQPEKALWIMAGMNNTIGQLNWVDQNGEPTNMLEASALVIPISEDVRKAMKNVWFVGDWFENSKELSLSAKSLNIFFGGEIIPGPGPLITLPVSELVKANPVLAAQINKATQDALPLIPGGEGLVDYLLPMGPSNKVLSYDQLLPTWVNQGLDANAIGRWFGSDYRGTQYVDAMGKVAAYESAKARLLGPDQPLPTEAEITAKVDALYNLKFISAFISPVSFQVKTEADLAKREYLKYKEIYGESADWMFLTQRPELIGAIASTTNNPYQLSPNLDTVANLENNPDVVNVFMNSGEAGKDMLGFFMNPSNNPEYDDYAYTYLTEKGAGLGEESYYTKLSVSERTRRAAAAAGWVYFNKLMTTIDAELIDTNTTLSTNTKLATYKATAIAELRKKYPEWATEYSKQDATKFAERARTIEQLLGTEQFVSKFGDKAETTAIAIFITQRNNVMNILKQRKALGYSGSIESKSNQDIAATYNQIIMQLKTESIRFADFYNRFFDGDSLVF